jgi:trk system potassium uptake protein TrkH
MPDNSEKKLRRMDTLMAIGGGISLFILLARYGIPRFSIPHSLLLAWAALFPIGLFLEAFFRLIWIKDPWHYLFRHPTRYIILLMILLELSGVAAWGHSRSGTADTSLLVGELYITIAMFAFIGNWIKGILAANRWLANRHIPLLLIPILTFSFVIFAGTLILLLPGFHRHSVAALDILFTVTSAVCVTGLTVFDLAKTIEPSGQVIVAFLIQLGGLGTMTTLGMLALWHGGRLTLGEKVLFRELVGGKHLHQTKRLLRTIMVITFTFELLGTISLGFLWRNHLPHAMLQGAFHAISAFCNAGFSLFPDGLIAFRQDRMSLLVMIALIVIGGLGYPVVADLYHTGLSRLLPWKATASLTKSSKVVLSVTFLLILVGTLAFWIDGILQHTPRTIFSSLFQSITCRTAGFQIESQIHFGPWGYFAALILMTIGASPQSTGGGIRTMILARLFIKIDPQDIDQKPKKLFFFKPFRIALFCITCYLSIAVAAAALLMMLEPLSWQNAVYEAFSALGTVGLSRDVTPTLSANGKLCVIFLMFSGRVLFPTMVIRIIHRRKPAPDPVAWI